MSFRGQNGGLVDKKAEKFHQAGGGASIPHEQMYHTYSLRAIVALVPITTSSTDEER
jgi:hypothetical protein